MLTPAQIAHFETFGFLILRRIFTPAEMATITCEANQIWRDGLERQPDENPYQIVVPFVEERPRLAQLPEDDRIYLPIVDLLGPGFIWGGSEGHKGSFTERNLLQWHSDRPDTIGVHYARIKVMIYLQPLQKQTGNWSGRCMFGNCAMVARFSALARETGRNPMVSRFKTTDESPAQCPWACNASLPSFQWQARIANVSGGPEPSQPTRCYLAGLFDTTVDRFRWKSLVSSQPSKCATENSVQEGTSDSGATWPSIHWSKVTEKTPARS